MKYIDPDGRFSLDNTINELKQSFVSAFNLDFGADYIKSATTALENKNYLAFSVYELCAASEIILDTGAAYLGAGILNIGTSKLCYEVTKLTVRFSSVHNKNANKIMLGKYDNGEYTSYINKAGSEYKYFDIGPKWDKIKSKFGLSDKDMFDLFNKPFLDDGIKSGATFHFSHDPTNATGALKDEFKHIMDSGKYDYIPETMTAVPIE